jgi:hypothetical protein
MTSLGTASALGFTTGSTQQILIKIDIGEGVRPKCCLASIVPLVVNLSTRWM